MILFLAVLVMTPKCATPRRSGRDRPCEAETEGENFAGPTEPLPDLSSLRFDVVQMVSDKEIVFSMTLTNAGTTPVRITTNPRVDDRSFDRSHDSEIEMQLVDSRRRPIFFGCTDRNMGAGARKIRDLGPGESINFSERLDPFCYDLVRGEKLSFIATYANLFAGSLEDRRGLPIPKVSSPEWLEIVVPADWPEKQ